MKQAQTGNPPAPQCVKEPMLSRSESMGFPQKSGKQGEKASEKGVLPTPICQLFQVHGSKFKPGPSCDGGQASVVCITHRVFLFRVCKDPFNGFFALRINLLRTFRFAYLFNQIQILLPDMRGVYLLPFFIRTTFSFARAISALRRCTSVRSFAPSVGSGVS